ncbi:MAG TPA: MFS transporter [Marmoricola sp.]|nr:MFS transporter [Marmoricola sp.]
MEHALTPRRRRAVLVVVAVALMMVVSAVSGLNVALPDLARDTGASQTQLTWIVDAYTVAFAGLLLLVGGLGDRYGRKGMLMAGLVLFGAAAGWAVTIHAPATLIAARALMGVGAAAVMPTTLSVITTSFPEEERGRAVGLWVGVAGGGAVVGLFGSGLLLEFFSWSSFFGLNVALALLALVGTIAVVPASREAGQPPLDVPGGVLSLVTVSSLVFAIIGGPERGWSDPAVLTGFAVAALAGPAFVRRELTADHPLLDVRLFALRGFGAGSLSISAQFFAAFGFFFIVLQHLQFVLGRSPLEAALTLLPLPFVLMPSARLAPRIAARLGTNRVDAAGLVSLAAGLAVISRLGQTMDYAEFYTGLALFGLGMGLAGTPATTAITASLPPAKQGVASAVNDLSREFGSALGIALLGSLLTAGYRDSIAPALAGLPPRLAEGARSSIAFVSSDAVHRLGPAGDRLVAAAQGAFVDGVSTALLTGAGVLLAAAVFVLFRAPGREAPAEGRQARPAEADAVTQRSLG